MRQILDTIREYEMIRPGMHVLAGVSGGADSVCLLYALREYQKECEFRLTVVHVEHGIRGEESMEDAAFVETLCRQLEIPCRVVHRDVPNLAAERGASLEEAARDARYQIFDEMMDGLRADVTAVAHNENDQAETVLWNLVRGSALKGLGGMQPVRGRLIRPLLFTSREEIEGILRERGISYRTDRTNLETEYTRNRLRLELIPYMEEHLNCRASKHISEASASLRDVQSYIDRCTADAAGRCIVLCREGVVLKLPEYRREDPYLQGELLRRCIRRSQGEKGLKDFGRIHIDLLRELAEKPCGKELHLPGGLCVCRQNEILLFREISQTDCDYMPPKDSSKAGKKREDRPAESGFILPLNGRTEIDGILVQTRQIPGIMVNYDEILSEKKYTKWLSYDTIVDNVCFRKRRTGDYLTVNATGGKKKLKDYMIDQKIPREKRDQMWLVADGSHVLWLPGYRISEAAKVTRETEQVLEITITIPMEEKEYERKSQDSFTGTGSQSADRGGGSQDQP